MTRGLPRTLACAVVTTLFVSTAARAEDDPSIFALKGQKMLSGTVSLGGRFDEDRKEFTFAAQPQIGYFVFDGLAIEAGPVLGYNYVKDDDSEDGVHGGTYGLYGGARYFLRLGSGGPLYPYAGAHLALIGNTFRFGQGDGTVDVLTVAADGTAGVVYVLGPGFFADLGVTARFGLVDIVDPDEVDDDGDTFGAIQLLLGFGGWF